MTLSLVFRRRHKRSDTGPTTDDELSPIVDLLEYLAAVRAGIGAVDVEELPAAVGLVTLFADVASSFPIVAVDRASGERHGEQPMTFAQPDPTEEVSDTVEAIVQSLAWTGNAYATRSDEWPYATCRVINPNLVTPVLMPNDDRAVDYWLVNGEPYALDEVVHWKINNDPRRGPLGRSPIRQCAPALRVYTAAYAYLADYFDEGGVPAQYFQATRNMQPDEMRMYRDEWVDARRTSRTGVVPRDMELKFPPTVSETDHVLAVIEAASTELGRVLRVPPSITNAAVAGYSLTYTNVADDLRRWLAIGLGPTWLRAIARGFSQLAPDHVRAEVDTSRGWVAELLDAADTEPTESPRGSIAEAAAARPIPARGPRRQEVTA